MFADKAKGGVFFAAFFISFSALGADAEYESKVIFDSVSLVLAAENNASPSSMMGHSFLKISGGGRVHAFGYYAVLNGGLKSYISALIGKQEGAYALSPYQSKAAEYLLSENRSLWEFELDLSTAEKFALKRKIWKLKGQSDTYSFVSHNCSSAVENLLKSVNPGYGFERTKPFTTPVEYAQFLYQAGKIKKISYVRAPAQKKRPVKNILSAAAPSRLAIDTTYIEFSPVYQDLRTVSDAYNSELETKMLSVRFDMQKGRPDKLDLLKLFSVQSVSKYFRVGWERGGVIETGIGAGISKNGFSAYAVPIVGVRDSGIFAGVKTGGLYRWADKAKFIVSYEAATDNTRFSAYAVIKIRTGTEIYVQYEHVRADKDKTAAGLAVYF